MTTKLRLFAAAAALLLTGAIFSTAHAETRKVRLGIGFALAYVLRRKR